MSMQEWYTKWYSNHSTGVKMVKTKKQTKKANATRKRGVQIENDLYALLLSVFGHIYILPLNNNIISDIIVTAPK
jgi:hypothetical protein